MEQLELAAENLVRGEAQINGDFLHRRAFPQKRPGSDHPLLTHPFLRADAQTFFENPAHMALRKADAAANLIHSIAAFARYLG